MLDHFFKACDFSPYFDPKQGGEAIEYRGGPASGHIVNTSIDACVMDLETAEPFSEDVSIGSKVRQIKVRFPISAWPWTDYRPKQGDKITRFDGTKYSVDTVDVTAHVLYALTARQIGG